MRAYFEEVQYLRNNNLMWVLIIVSFLAGLIPLAYGMYWQVGQEQPWGDKPMSDPGLIGLFLFILLCFGVACFSIYVTRLEVRIDAKGVHYRFVPYRPRWRQIVPEEVSSYELKKTFGWVIGYHHNMMSNTRTLNISGSKLLSLTLTNHRRIQLGTQNPEGIERAMRKLFDPNRIE